VKVLTEPVSPARTAPTTAEGFLADRTAFYGNVTRAVTYVVAFLVALLAFLWWWLV
jgi:hypothetical protein